MPQPGRVSSSHLQRKALMGQDRQAEALERIAAVLESLYDEMYPTPAESVSVEPVQPETAPVEPGYETPNPPMESEDESGESSEV